MPCSAARLPTCPSFFACLPCCLTQYRMPVSVSTPRANACLPAYLPAALPAAFRPYDDATGVAYPHAWVYTYHLYYPWCAASACLCPGSRHAASMRAPGAAAVRFHTPRLSQRLEPLLGTRTGTAAAPRPWQRRWDALWLKWGTRQLRQACSWSRHGGCLMVVSGVMQQHSRQPPHVWPALRCTAANRLSP